MKKLAIVPMLQMLTHILVLRPFLKLFSGVNIVGKENVRGAGRYVIIANHNSHLDICLMFSIIPARHIPRTHAVADRDYFSASPLVCHAVRFLFNPIFISRGRPKGGEDPLDEIRAKLRAGHNIIIFPEGTRGEPGELQRFKSGIGRLMVEFPDMPIVPVFISGAERGLPKSKVLLLPFCNNITIGPPRLCTGKHRDITSSLEHALRELSASDAIRRHVRPDAKSPPRSIAFLGIDGSGKSTCSKRVAMAISESSGVCRISDRMDFFEGGEEREMQPLMAEKIRETIGGHAKTARSLKMYKIPKLTELLLRNHLQQEAGRWYVPDLIVMDGSPLLNIVAWASLYKEDMLDHKTCAKAIRILAGRDADIPRDDSVTAQFPELLTFRRYKLNRLMLPDIVIFLDVPPDVAYGRISTRGEQKQVHETEDKLGMLRKGYLMVCDVLKRELAIPTMTINGDDSLDSITETAVAFVRKSMDLEAASNEDPR